MNANEFTTQGTRLYGRHGWKSELADALKISRTTVWRYAKGERPIPESVALALETLAERQRPPTPEDLNGH